MRFDMELEAALGDEDVGADDTMFERAMQGMM